MLQRLLAIVTPDSCLNCDAEGALLCRACIQNATITAPSRCFFCFAVTANGTCCKNCRTRTGIHAVQTCGAYTGTLKALLYAYKFEHNRAASTALARLLFPKMPAPHEEMLITYVPTVERHIRERGFDHARLLAKTVAKKRRTSPVPLLVRYAQTTQLGASKAVRMKNMTNAFAIKPSTTLHGKHVVLIDDVITTGATILAAARVLKDAGAARVTVVAVARA